MRCGEAQAELWRLRPEALLGRASRLLAHGLDESLLSPPIVSGPLHAGGAVSGLGYSGYAPTGQAREGISAKIGGSLATGSIFTTNLGYGEVGFNGNLIAGNFDDESGDATFKYFWIRNWSFLIPFPAPAISSMFTYRFGAQTWFDLSIKGAEAQLLSFVSLGETANLLPGQNLPISADGGWPVIADPHQVTSTYNGLFGQITGKVAVQRSFAVAAGQTSAILVVVGAIVATSINTAV